MCVRPTTAFVFGSMRSSVGCEKRLTQTEPPPAAAAHGWEPVGTPIFAVTVGVFAPAAAAPAATAKATRAMESTRIMVRARSRCSEVVFLGDRLRERGVEPLERVAHRRGISEPFRQPRVDPLQRRPSGAPLLVACGRELEQLRAAV